MKKVYKKSSMVFDMTTCTDRQTDDMHIICGGYICKVLNGSLMTASRIHFIATQEAVDLDGNKYTFSDTCFVVSRLLGGQRTVHTDFATSIPQESWQKTQGTLDGNIVSIGSPAYTLTPGTKIFIDGHYKVIDTQLCTGGAFVSVKNASSGRVGVIHIS
jgi:hypothetical protein